ncbi:MAG: hypothetical protein ACK5MR_02505 [Cumulibacter sp.]
MSHPPPHRAGHGDPHRASDEASATESDGVADNHSATDNHSARDNDSATTHETYDQQYDVYVPDAATAHYRQYSDYTAAPYADQEQPRLSYFADSSQYYQEQQGAYHQSPHHADTAHYAPAEPPARTGALWWGIGGIGVIAAILSILVMTGVFDASVDEPGANPQATGDYSNPSDPKALRVIDKASGISYDYLGEGWKDYSMGVMEENQATVGEYVVTQESVPSGGQFIAQVTSGLLSTSFGSPSAAQFPQALAEVEESVFGNYYPLPNEPTNQSERALTIDGHDAYERITDLTWDVDGYDSTGERVHLLLIDTGKSAPVFFYCSFPNTHAELYPLIDQVIASIKVDQ